jgi:hypothetical protein
MNVSLPRLLNAVLIAGVLTWLAAWRPFSPDMPVEESWLELSTVEPFTGTLVVSVDEGHGYGFGIINGFRRAAEPRKAYAQLPPGRIRAIQAMIYAAPRVTFTGGRIRSTTGESLAEIPPAGFQPKAGTQAFAAPGGTLFQPRPPEAEEITLELKPAKPVYVPSGNEPWAAEVLGMFLLIGGVVYWMHGRFAPGQLDPLRAKVRAFAQGAAGRPKLTLLLVALVSAIASSYPLVFAGKSLVSPNHFIPLLYARQPTVPGAPIEPQEDPKGADHGAMMWQTQPYSALVSRTLLRDRELPLWNRYTANGVSLLAQHLSMAADPLNLLFLAAEGAWWSWDARFILAKALLALGIGLCAWHVTGRLGPSALIGASAPWIGYFGFRFDHPAIFSLCYAPWVLLPWLAAASARSRRELWLWGLALIAADWAELNSGTGKESSMLLLFMNVGGLTTLLLATLEWRERVRRAAVLTAASVMFLLLSAPCWLLFADALRQAFTIYDVPHAYQLQPSLALGFFDEIFIQEFSRNQYHTSPSLNFLILAGFVWFLCARPSLRKNRAAFALLLAALPVAAVVFGIVPPSWIVGLPLIGKIQHIHNTFGCVLMIWVMILAAAGLSDSLDAASAATWQRTWRRLLVTLAVLMLAYCGFTQAVPQPPYSLYSVEPHLHSRFYLAYAPFLLLAAAAFPWALRTWRAGGAFQAAGASAFMIALLVVHFRHGLHLGTKFDDCVVNPKTGVALEADTPALASVRQELRKRNEPARTVGFGAVFMPGYNVLVELEGLSGAEPLINPYFRQLYTAAALRNEWGWRLNVEEETLAALKPVYDLLGIRYYFRDPALRKEPLPKLRPIAQHDLDLYESAEAWPRAFFTDHLLTYDTPEQFVDRVKRGDGRPFAAVQGPHPAAGSETQPNRQVVAARDYRLTPNTTEFTLTAPGPGVAVLGESFEEGNFRVTVNGAPAAYFRVDHIFKGVLLTAAGDYRIRFTYWPRLLTPALATSAVGALLIIAASAVLLRRRGAARTSTPSPSPTDRAVPDPHGRDRGAAQSRP